MYLQELVLQSESVKCNNSNAKTLNKPMPTLACNSITCNSISTRVLRKHGTTLVMHVDNLCSLFSKSRIQPEEKGQCRLTSLSIITTHTLDISRNSASSNISDGLSAAKLRYSVYHILLQNQNNFGNKKWFSSRKLETWQYYFDSNKIFCVSSLRDLTIFYSVDFEFQDFLEFIVCKQSNFRLIRKGWTRFYIFMEFKDKNA